MIANTFTSQAIANTTSEQLSHDDLHTLQKIALYTLQESLLVNQPTGQLDLGLNPAERGHQQPRRPKPLITPPLQQICGVWLQLRVETEVRGQALSLYGAEPLHREVAALATKAAFHDARTAPLRAEELESLDIFVATLTQPCRIHSPLEYNPQNQGLILQHAGKVAWQLPMGQNATATLADNLLNSLADACGLNESSWSKANLYTFQVLSL